MKLQNYKTIVTTLLTKYPSLRDSDDRLLANIWSLEIKDQASLDTLDFLRLVANKKISSPFAVSRARRKIQENIPSLRGKKWAKRHEHQPEIINQLKTKF
ncbi:MAG: hypothetical protein ACTSU6_06120 [Candidatus Njordarchaeales archaeon]